MSSRNLKTWVEISAQAIRENAAHLKTHIAPAGLMAIVKANAYGHDRAITVPLLKKAGVAWFGVDSIDEALDLVPLAGDTPVLILGYVPPERLRDAVQHNIRLTVYQPETVRALGKAAKHLNRSAYLHVKCETGAVRQGVSDAQLLPLVKLIGKYPGLIFEGISSHFANSENIRDVSFTERQLLAFKRQCALLENHGVRVPVRHIAATAAGVLYPETRNSLARVGIGLYGLWPSANVPVALKEKRKRLILTPALTWKTRIAQVKAVPRGTAIGYGLTERVTRNSNIAVLPIGYWDGYDRHLSSKGIVLIRGKRAKIVGRICMNMCMADVTDIRGVRREEEVVLLGAQGKERISAEELADLIGTINYEVVTRINPLIPRIKV
ncbi:MAG: alanine racemase [bacterium]|nr:alanine racemase [bacterium]